MIEKAEGPFELAGRRICVAGCRGMVGRAIVRRLERERCEVIGLDRAAVDLTRQAETEAWMAEVRPEVIFLAAARVGGIHANNTFPAEFIYQNLAIELNVVHAAWRVGVAKLIFLGSSCIYPKHAPQPMPEEALLTGPLEPTNEWYAVAKIAGIKLCAAYRRQHGCDFISAMPTNLYGPHDNFDLSTSHVVPALIRKLHEAKIGGGGPVEIWGTGTPRREFLHVDDAADALVFLARHYSGEAHMNVGTGQDVTIAELAQTITEVVGAEVVGAFKFNADKPDGTPRKLMDVSRLSALGWRASIGLREGLASAYRWYVDQQGG